jgi:hypothetical protein
MTAWLREPGHGDGGGVRMAPAYREVREQYQDELADAIEAQSGEGRRLRWRPL